MPMSKLVFELAACHQHQRELVQSHKMCLPHLQSLLKHLLQCITVYQHSQHWQEKYFGVSQPQFWNEYGWTFHLARIALLEICLGMHYHPLCLQISAEVSYLIKFDSMNFTFHIFVDKIRWECCMVDRSIAGWLLLQWASYQMCKIAGCACIGNPGHRLQRKPLVNDPGMHHGICVTHVPWWKSGSLNHGAGENVPGIPGACATRNVTYLARGPCRQALQGPLLLTWFTAIQTWINIYM